MVVLVVVLMVMRGNSRNVVVVEGKRNVVQAVYSFTIHD